MSTHVSSSLQSVVQPVDQRDTGYSVNTKEELDQMINDLIAGWLKSRPSSQELKKHLISAADLFVNPQAILKWLIAERKVPEGTKLVRS